MEIKKRIQQINSLIAKSMVNLSPKRLVAASLSKKEVIRHSSGSVVVITGYPAARSPDKTFRVLYPSNKKTIDWGEVNKPMEPKAFDYLFNQVLDHLKGRENIYTFEGLSGADPVSQVPVTVISPYADQALFAHHMFIREKHGSANRKKPLTILCAPDLPIDMNRFGINTYDKDHDKYICVAADFDHRIVLLTGTRYSGEIKKSAFTFMNYHLPAEFGILPMHCSANQGQDSKTALFFGLSGTGKTTLSTDPSRRLIGDDEHGWSENGIFNFEGGCYAKTINLSKIGEPFIWKAVHRKNSLLENVPVKNGEFDFDDIETLKTPNTRAAYPLDFIKDSLPADVYKSPSYIIFLTYDAYGVFPAVARLDTDAAIYHFLSGYTSITAGTVKGIVGTKATFSHCFGAPFIPLKPGDYAKLLEKRLAENPQTKVYMVNTGLQGGPIGTGTRINLSDTRRIIDAILNGNLDDADTTIHSVLNLEVPNDVPGIDRKILNPRELWKNTTEYDDTARLLAEKFTANMARFKDIPDHVVSAGPRVK